MALTARQRNALPAMSRPPVHLHDKLYVLTRWQHGASIAELCVELGRSERTLRRWIADALGDDA
jgi:hypothetical protein